MLCSRTVAARHSHVFVVSTTVLHEVFARIPGLHGWFVYLQENIGLGLKLTVESWSRLREGSDHVHTKKTLPRELVNDR